ncbi:MAG: hypothetical protein J6Z32_06825 [Bacteroidales bacterium]|nr:hypothetical protein [Bacteroidales bacterium]
MQKSIHTGSIILLIIVFITGCSAFNKFTHRFRYYRYIDPYYRLAPIVKSASNNQKSKIFVSEPVLYFADADTVFNDKLLYAELPLNLFPVGHNKFISYSEELIDIHIRDSTENSNSISFECSVDNKWPKFEHIVKIDPYAKEGIWLFPWRHHYKLVNEEFKIFFYNIKRCNIDSYNQIINSLKILDGLNYYQIKKIDRQIERTWRFNDQLFRHNDDSYSLTKIVKSTRPSIYDTDNKSNLFTIDKITKVRGDLYLIEATRNDSLFLIFSQDGLQHILDSKIIKKGGVYSIKLKKLYPDEYPQNNDNKHISIYLQRYFYGLKDNHHMAYKALDLNGLHLEIAE